MTFTRTTLLLLCISYSACAQESTRLVYDLAKGMRNTYELQNNVQQTVAVPTEEGSRDINSDIRSRSLVRMSVTDAVMNQASLTFTFDSATVNVGSVYHDGTLADSTIPLDAINGLQIGTTISRSGEVLDWSILTSSTNNEMAKAMVLNMRLLEKCITILPNNDVRPGDTWQHTYSDTLPAPVGEGRMFNTIPVTFTYKGNTDTLGMRCWVITAESRTISQRGIVNTAGYEMDLNGNGTMQSWALLDSRTGLLVTSVSQLRANLRMKMGGAQPMVVPISTVVTSELRRLKAK